MTEDSKPEFTKKELDSAPKKKRVVRRKKTVVAEEPLSIETENRIKKELKHIYQNDDGSMPDMADFRKQKSHGLLRAMLFLLISCLFLGTVAWAGFFFLQPKSQFVEEDVILSMTGTTDVAVGKDVTYRVRYRNAQNVPLSKVVLQIKYPDGFTFVSASKMPSNDTKDEWNLGSLQAQEGGYIDLVGRVYGDLDKKASFRIFLNYIPANFSSEFQKVASLNISITDTPVNFAVQSPSEVVANAPVDLIVDIKKTEEAVNNIAFIIEPGKMFSKVSAKPENDEDNLYQWSFKDLKEDKQIKIKGIFISENGSEEAEVLFKVMGWKDAKKQDEPFVLRQQVVKVKLIKSELSASLAINGSMNNLNVQPGEVLNITLALKNSGQSAIKNVSARLIFDTQSVNKKSLLNWTKIEDSADGDISGEQTSETVRRGIISWTAKNVKELASIAPGSEAHIDLSIPLKEQQSTDLTDFTTYLMSALTEIKYTSQAGAKMLSSNQIQMIVNSDLALDVQDGVATNDQAVDTYAVSWVLSNSFHELKDIELSADIYGDIAWLDKKLTKPAGEAVFDPVSKRLTWKISSMPVSIDVLALKFAFVLNTKNPTQTQLMSKVNVKAFDTVTNQEIILVGDEILLNVEEEIGVTTTPKVD